MRYRDIAWVAALLFAHMFGVAPAALQQYSFDRYQSILDRQPFGEVQPEESNKPPPGPVAPPFTKDITMCAITKDDSGIQVGFINVAVKPPKSYFLRVGQTEDEITLVRADYEREMALLERGGDEQWISMAGPVSMGEEGPVDSIASSAGESPSVTRLSAGVSDAMSRAAKTESYAERLRARREAMKARSEAAGGTKLEGEALKKHLEEYQMELIRSGMPALPIPLTPEMDAQLVSEGVLPPTDGSAPDK